MSSSVVSRYILQAYFFKIICLMPMDTKYDRQIRLFGADVQERLFQMSVHVVGTVSALSSEIIKNLVLLGVSQLALTAEAKRGVKQLVPDELNELNKALIITESVDKPCDFTFAVDCSDISGVCYFICSRCLFIQFGDCVHDCHDNPVRSHDKSVLLAVECLAGAFVVQEFLKYVSGKPHIEQFRIEL